MQAQAFGFANLTQEFDVTQQQQKQNQASAVTINGLIHGILMPVLTILTTF